jgi:hypothetical protein
MGNGTSQHTSALGGFSSKGTGVHMEKRKKLNGRFVDVRFATNDELMAFLNGDVLPRINASARYTKAIKVDDHTIFLLANGEAINDPEAAWTAFVNTFKGLSSVLEIETPEKFAEIKFGSSGKRSVSAAMTESDSDSRRRWIESNMAVHSQGGFEGHNRDS